MAGRVFSPEEIAWAAELSKRAIESFPDSPNTVAIWVQSSTHSFALQDILQMTEYEIKRHFQETLRRRVNSKTLARFSNQLCIALDQVSASG